MLRHHNDRVEVWLEMYKRSMQLHHQIQRREINA